MTYTTFLELVINFMEDHPFNPEDVYTWSVASAANQVCSAVIREVDGANYRPGAPSRQATNTYTEFNNRLWAECLNYDGPTQGLGAIGAAVIEAFNRERAENGERPYFINHEVRAKIAAPCHPYEKQMLRQHYSAVVEKEHARQQADAGA